jgi:hypothetical protein
MQAYFETEAYLPVNHSLNLQLPDDIPAGKVRIAVIYEKPSQNDNNKFIDEKGSAQALLNALKANPLQGEAQLSDAQITAQIAEIESSWES